MRLSTFSAWLRASIILGAPLLLTGCGKPYRVAEVDGTIKLHNQPANKIQIQFFPDASKSTVGPSSTGVSDAKGHYVLILNDSDASKETLGAVVGWHHVSFTDLGRANSETGASAALRFGSEYMQPATSPISEEVKDEKQTIDIQLP